MPDDEIKTRPTDADVDAYLDGVDEPRRREDARAALALMREVTGAEPQMWGTSMIGFGRRPYTTADGRTREWFVLGLAARKAALTLYGLTDDGSEGALLDRLGPHTTGKSCLYLKRMDAVDREVLTELVRRAWSADESSARES